MLKYILVLQGSMICSTCSFNFFVIVRIVYPAVRRIVDQFSISEKCMHCQRVLIIFLRWRLLANRIYPSTAPLWDVFIGYTLTILHSQFSSLFLFISNLPSITMMPSDSTSSATDANVVEIAKSHVPADQPGPILHINTATSRCFNLLLPFHRIAEIDITVLFLKTAATEPKKAIGKSDVCTAVLPLSLH